MKKTAVIGANGFLGKYIVAELLKNDHLVTCVYNNTVDPLSDCAQVSINAFVETDAVFDNIVFAAGSYLNTHEQLVAINCSLVQAIIKKHNNARFIYISSVNVYGLHPGVITENSSFNSPLLYGRSKLAGEFIAASCKSFAIIRFTYLYGPGLNNGSFLPKIIEQATTGKNITLMGEGERKQDYLYVTDAATLCVKVIESDLNEIYLGVSGKSYSNLDVAKAICLNVKDCTISFTGEEKGASFYFDPQITNNKISWAPQIDIVEGIKNCLL